MPDKITSSDVIQADRDEAADAHNRAAGWQTTCAEIRKGLRDGHPLVQAFAKHRINHAKIGGSDV